MGFKRVSLDVGLCGSGVRERRGELNPMLVL